MRACPANGVTVEMFSGGGGGGHPHGCYATVVESVPLL